MTSGISPRRRASSSSSSAKSGEISRRKAHLPSASRGTCTPQASSQRAASALAPKYLIVVSAESVALMAAAALVMALAAAFLPARYLARLDPATAFRQ